MKFQMLGATVLGTLFIAACAPQATSADDNADEEISESAAPPAPTQAADDEAGDVASLAAPRLTPEAEKGGKGACNVLLEWAHALENKDFSRAYAQWGHKGETSGMSAEQYRRAYARYDAITVAVGLGTVEGAAGSLYYEVPVTITGTLPGGGTETLQGPVTVRRVNDVDGASPEQLRWHIESAQLEPAES